MSEKGSKIFMFFFWSIFILIWASPFLAEFSYVFEDMQINPFDYARITDVEYRAVVVDKPDSEGKVVITERLTFDIHAASRNNLFWELWRDLPEDNVDGLKVDYKVNSVKQILDDGTEIIYEESPKLYWDDEDYISTNKKYGPGKWYHSEGPYDEEDAQYECVFFYVDGLYREEVVFEIEYEMYNAALRYNDCSDLYLALYSETTINHLESYKAEILFPNEDMPAPGNYEVYTYGTNANEFPVEESATKNPGYYTFFFELDEDDLKFRPYNEYIEFDLVSYNEDKHIFTEYAPDNYYSSDDVLWEIREEQKAYANKPTAYSFIKIILLLGSLGIGALILFYNFTVDKRMKKKHYIYEPTTYIDFYRDIPSDLDPNFAADLVFCKQKAPEDDSGVYSAILLSLVRKEYIELRETSSDDVQIIIKKPIVRAPINTNPGYDNPLLQRLVSSEPVIVNNSTGLYNTQTPSSVPMTGTVTGTITDTTTETTAEPEIPEKVYEPLTLCEQYYFDLIVRHAVGDSIFMKSFQSRVSTDYENTDSFVRNMEYSTVNIGVKQGYFQKAYYYQPKDELLSGSKALWIVGLLFIILVNILSYQSRLDLAFGGYTIIGICCIISAVYLKKQAPKYVLLTQFGADEYAKWRGLYNFLNSETLMNERTFVELPIWEKYLIYATAFGIPQKVIDAIGIRCPESVYSPILSNGYCNSGRIHRSSRSFRSSVHRSSSIHRSSGGGGGFGYGGGGRGGGGGGGGH